MDKRFNGEMLALARQVRKVSQPELAKRLGDRVSQAHLSKVETGRIQPDKELVDLIAEVLGYKPGFFYEPVYRRMPPVSFHRKRQKLGVKDLEAVHGQAEIYRINLRRMLEAVELTTRLPPLPSIDPDQYHRKINVIADTVRQRWGIPRGPISDLTKIIEDSGIIVVSFDFGTALIDGFSQHGGDGLPPIIFMNSVQPKDRYRFSLAHELAHLAMHQVPHPEMEVEANLFASEFLMPRRDIEAHLYNLSLRKFMELKLYWRVSMQALIYKSWETGRISDRMFKYYNIEMAKRGFKSREPVELTGVSEAPATLGQIIQEHVNTLEYTVDDLSDLFGLLPADVRALYPVGPKRPMLRIVT